MRFILPRIDQLPIRMRSCQIASVKWGAGLFLRRYMSKTRQEKIIENGGYFTQRQFRLLCKLFGNHCVCCGKKDDNLHADHIIPVAKGGHSNISNIQPLCRDCNLAKHTSEQIDYRKSFFNIFVDDSNLQYFVKINFLINIFYEDAPFMIYELAEAWGMNDEQKIIFANMTGGL